MTPVKKPQHASPAADFAGRWLAESFRITLFLSSAQPKIPDLWDRIAGTPPDTVTERPAQGMRQSMGPFGNGVLSVNQLPGRVDIIYSPKAPSESEIASSPFVDIGPFSEAESLFTSRATAEINDFTSVIRVGYASIVLIVDTDQVSSNRVIAAYMPELNIDPENDSDIIVQINKPKLLPEAGGAKINRIFKWQVAEMQLIHVAGVSSLPSKIISNSMCRLDLDLSTDARSHSVIDNENLKKTISEMQKEARKIILTGDK